MLVVPGPHRLQNHSGRNLVSTRITRTWLGIGAYACCRVHSYEDVKRGRFLEPSSLLSVLAMAWIYIEP
jgi:hypothetical protein